jgi:hypothetical protein
MQNDKGKTVLQAFSWVVMVFVFLMVVQDMFRPRQPLCLPIGPCSSPGEWRAAECFPGANGPGICLAQPNGLGIRVPKRTKGPTARPLARVAQTQTYRSSISSREDDVQPDLSVRLWHGVTTRCLSQMAGPLALGVNYRLDSQADGLG